MSLLVTELKFTDDICELSIQVSVSVVAKKQWIARPYSMECNNQLNTALYPLALVSRPGFFLLYYPAGAGSPAAGAWRGRKVRAPQGRMPEKFRRTRVQGKCRRKYTARKGKGEKAGQEPTGASVMARPGKPHQEQGRIGEDDAARRLTGRPLIPVRKGGVR